MSARFDPAKLPDPGELVVGVLDRDINRYVVGFKFVNVMGRRIGPAGVGQDDLGAKAGLGHQPLQNGIRHILLIANVAGKNHIPALFRGRSANKVFGRGRDFNTIMFGVQAGRGDRHRINVVG